MAPAFQEMSYDEKREVLELPTLGAKDIGDMITTTTFPKHHNDVSATESLKSSGSTKPKSKRSGRATCQERRAGNIAPVIE